MSPNTLFLHFNVPNHQIDLKTFLSTATEVQNVFDALNNDLFGGAIEAKLILVPPEEGTFLGKIKIITVSGGVFLFAFLHSPVGEAYVEGLTGQTPQHWAKALGEYNRSLVEKSLQEQSEADEGLEDLLLVEFVKGVLSKNNQELQNISPTETTLNDAMIARSSFYDACLSDREVSAVGFDPSENFPINRQDFPVLARRPEAQAVEETRLEWHIRVEKLFVTSPNWDRATQQVRKWKGKDADLRDCLFIIDDDLFWNHVKFHNLKVDILDELKVQWVFQIREQKIINRKVVRVLEYNGDIISEQLPLADVRNYIQSIDHQISSDEQRDLFE